MSAEMSSDSEFDKSQLEFVFLKRIKDEHIKKKPTNSIASDYKMLLILSMIGGLPISLLQLPESDDTNACCLLVTLVCGAFHVCRTLLCLFTSYFAHVLLPVASLEITFDIFIWSSLIASWILFFKKNAILYAMRTTISTAEHVNSSKFQSSWNIRVFIFLLIVGVASILTPLVFISLDSRVTFSSPSVTFLGYEVEEKHHDVLLRAVIVSLSLTYVLSAFYCGIIVMISSTMYFHLGDVILNFGTKLNKRFLYKAFSNDSLSANLAVFQKTMHLNEAINNALSASVLFIYGAVIACFFKAVSLALTYGTEFIELFLLDVFAFIFAMATFFMMTISGNRVWKKNQKLQEISVECSRIVIACNPEERWAVSSSLVIEVGVIIIVIHQSHPDAWTAMLTTLVK